MIFCKERFAKLREEVNVKSGHEEECQENNRRKTGKGFFFFCEERYVRRGLYGQ